MQYSLIFIELNLQLNCSFALIFAQISYPALFLPTFCSCSITFYYSEITSFRKRSKIEHDQLILCYILLFYRPRFARMILASLGSLSKGRYSVNITFKIPCNSELFGRGGFAPTPPPGGGKTPSWTTPLTRLIFINFARLVNSAERSWVKIMQTSLRSFAHIVYLPSATGRLRRQLFSFVLNSFAIGWLRQPVWASSDRCSLKQLVLQAKPVYFVDNLQCTFVLNSYAIGWLRQQGFSKLKRMFI